MNLEKLEEKKGKIEQEIKDVKEQQRVGLFTLEDIKPQLNEKQIKEMEHLIYMAKELKEPQGVHIGVKHMIIWPSGKMCLYTPEKRG